MMGGGLIKSIFGRMGYEEVRSEKPNASGIVVISLGNQLLRL
jgi:hypothetical protein